MIHVGARYYEVETGRWVQKDPQSSTLNLYAYSINSPLNAVDIDGRVPLILVVGAVVGIVAGAVLDYVENGELDKPWMPIVGGVVGYVGGGIIGAWSGGPGTYITLARLGPIAVSVDQYRRGGGGINVRIINDTVTRLIGLDWHHIPTAWGRLCLPHIDSDVLGWRHWPWLR